MAEKAEKKLLLAAVCINHCLHLHKKIVLVQGGLSASTAIDVDELADTERPDRLAIISVTQQMPEISNALWNRQSLFEDFHVSDVNQAHFVPGFRNNDIIQMDRAEQDALFVQFGKERRKLRHQLIRVGRFAQRIPEGLSRDRPVSHQSPFNRRATIDSLDTDSLYPEGFQGMGIFHRTRRVGFEDRRREKPLSAKQLDDEPVACLEDLDAVPVLFQDLGCSN